MPPRKKTTRERQKTFFKEWRDFRGRKQNEVAELLGVEPSTLSRLERGLSPYDQDVLEKLSLIYLCDPEDLLSIDPLKPDPPRLIYAKLKTATPEKQKLALNLIEAILKDGTNG